MEHRRPLRSRRRRPVRNRVKIALLIFFVVLLGIGLVKGGKYIPVLWDLFFKQELQFTKTTTPDQKLHLLLLGVGGGSHDGPDLTDTIIYANIDPNTKRVTLVSIPRDMWVPDLGAKVNTVYTFAEQKQEGSGLDATKDMVTNILGQPIDYAVKIDFNGFVKAVDMMGGLDITVDNTFDDYEYPLSGMEADPCGLTEDRIASLSAEIASGSATPVDAFPCRYEHLHFDKGPQKMDGETSLKYVRSRHGTGKEGSDFARSKRQEKVIASFKERMMSVDTFLNPVKLVNLMNILQDSIKTDIKEEEYDDFIKLAKKLEGAKIHSAVLDTGDQSEERYGLLENPRISSTYKNQWVLSPKAGNGEYGEIQKYVACQIKGENCMVGRLGTVVTPTLTPTPRVTKAPRN
jgi:polyisoprenyl-teichoic acid--peptidoglycan teichoic acid transferase